MRILFLTDTLTQGGKERQLIELLKGLEQNPTIHQELVVLSDIIEYSYVKKLNTNIHILKREYRYDPKIFVKLFNICKKFRPDIIHSWETMCSIYAIPAAKFLGLKFINGSIRNATGIKKKFSKSWGKSKFLFPLSDAILTNSIAAMRAYNLPPEKSYCVHNGFDFKRIENLENEEKIRKKFDIKTRNVVGMVASFTPKKDYKTFLEAAIRIIRKGYDITFLAIGAGSTLEPCKKMVPPEFRARIRFLGAKNKIESIINALDIGVLLTNRQIHEEGISNSILEYMALSKPVIASRCGGSEELVVDAVTGYLIDGADTSKIIKKICYLVDNSKRAKKMGAKGRERVMQDFSLEKMTNNMISLYHNLLN